MEPPNKTIKALIVASHLVEKDDKVLLVQEKGEKDNKSWDFPGGTVEPGETIEQAARRELLEETGIEAGRLKLLSIYEGLKDGQLRALFHFRTRPKTPMNRKPVTPDVIQSKWFTKEELKQLVKDKKVRPNIYKLKVICDHLNGDLLPMSVKTLIKTENCPCGSGLSFNDCHAIY